jgi:predicted transcriptional regulator
MITGVGKMRIGIIGSEQFYQEIELLKVNYPHVEFIPFLYTSPLEANKLISPNKEKVDVFLFSGIIPYFYSKEVIREENITATFVPFSQLMVSLSLFQLVHQKNIPFDRISLDLPDRKDVIDVLAHLNEQHSVKHIIDYPWIYQNEKTNHHTINVQEFVRFHERLYELSEVDYCLTSIHAVFDELKRKKIPAMFMIQTKSSTIQGIEDAIELGEMKKQRQSQIAVLNIDIHGMEDLHDSDKQKINHEIEEMSRYLNGKLVTEEHEKWRIYTTRGALDLFLNKDSLKEMFHHPNTNVYVGIGYGPSLKSAEQNAEDALLYAIKKNFSTGMNVWLIDESKRLMPIDILTDPENTKAHLIKGDTNSVKQLAEEIGLSIKNVNRMLDFLACYPESTFTADDFANYFHITRRTAERIIKPFYDHQLLINVGEEKPFEKGRPRIVYSSHVKLRSIIRD